MASTGLSMPIHHSLWARYEPLPSTAQLLTRFQSFGASLKTLVLLLASDRIKSPSDVIQRLAWTSTDKPEFAAAEVLYAKAFVRFLNGLGRVDHPLLPAERLSDAEKSISPTDPLARSLMFLLYATGSPLLPAGKIDVSASL